jgi:hypothetical protein
VLKSRLTQEVSFPLTFPISSANKRIDMEACVEMTRGWCLSCNDDVRCMK